jgi:hypothetical protein
VTRYGLDGPGIESRWGQDFQHPSTPALGPTQLSYTMETGSFPKVKRPGCGADHEPPSSACYRMNFTLPLPVDITLVARQSPLGLSVAVPFKRKPASKTKASGQ